MLFIIILIVLVLGFLSPNLWSILKRRINLYIEDAKLISFYHNKKRWEPYVDANKMTLVQKIPLKICVLSMDNRNEKFIDYHNKNLVEYTKKYSNPDLNRIYVYKFYKECNLTGHKHNIYWCKFHMLLNLLESDNYDYVVWLDSDTIIADPNRDIGDILSSYNSDIFLPLDKKTNYSVLNAGICMIKNSQKGKEFFQCICANGTTTNFEERCFDENNDLRGGWALSCYEQGTMNKIAWDFRNWVTVLPLSIVRSGCECEKYSSFILHIYAETSEKRENCFKDFITE